MSERAARAPRHWRIFAGSALGAICCLPTAAAPADQAAPPPAPPAATPPPSATAERTPPPSTVPGADQPVSLEEAIQIAFQNHANVAIAEEQLRASQERVRQARTGVLPSINAQLGYSGSGTSNLGGIFGGQPTQTIQGPPGTPPIRVPVDTDNVTFNQGLQPRLGLNYTVFNGGLTRAQVRQARAGVETSQAGVAAVRNNQAFSVTTNYLVQLRAERLLELRLVQEELAAEQLRSVDARIRAGNAAAAERALILSELRNRQVDRIQAQNDVRVAANTLRNTMGLPVGPALKLVQLREQVDELPPLDALREIARRNRPEVVQDEAQVRAAQAGVSIARVGRLPRLDTTFQFNVAPNNPLQRSNFSVGALVSLPIWDAGLTHSREQEARTQVQSASAQLEQTKKDVSAEVVEAYLNLVNARQRLEASRLAVEASQVNLEATTSRYQIGAPGTDVVDLIQAQVQFATANNNAISALYDVYLAQAQLNRSLGRL